MEMTDFGRVGVLMGGVSSEREISLKSGKAVFAALKGAGVDAAAVDISSEDPRKVTELLESRRLDCAFIALHGRFGEDGGIQEILERMDIPFTASGVKASRLAMDKIGSLEIFSQGGLFVPKSWFIEKASYRHNPSFTEEAVLNSQLGFPQVVKPANHGSSIGLSLVERRQELPEAIRLAFRYDEHAIIQEYLAGRELTVGILDETALPVIEIVTKHKFFDFSAKYQTGMTQYIVPAALEAETALEVRRTALRAHKLLGCYGCSRVDIILSGEGVPYVLEINTVPGMTETSLLPKAAKITGMDFTQLCLKLLELAYAKAKI
ncbi:MAG: D-alanine--D-alanine ligase [Candidatus Omnitrophica bacterium]|jgi:D-alanine-D-alanine ligase|nr:D-alanine--D-alanine ligase [Candidatus Omnitrophota bacterium]MDD3274158.1 D-alanine--D-alanine ligase [Candidatus Omnitrophota bacterium]MDD5077524.1 D-alanine--D-alanine ligase [Candidatus Omnitrophota bacterium]MDD5724568.1 D-alanine--D-alanine ligase [Candidatus Omnitrophota bacterium]